MKFERTQVIKVAISFGIGILLLYILFQFVDLQGVLLRVQKLSPLEIIAIIPLGLGVPMIAAFRWYAVLRAMNKTKRVPYWQTLVIYLAGYPAGYLFPSYGATSQVSRAVISEHYGLPRKLHVSSLSLEFVIHGAVHLVSMSVGLFLLLLGGYTLVQKYLWLFVFVAIVLFFAGLILWRRAPKKLRVYKKEIARAFHKSPVWICVAFATVFCGYLWAYFEIFCFAKFIEIDFSAYGIFLYSILAVIFLGVPSPLTLGTNEATGAATFTILGLAPDVGVALSLVYRLAYLMPPLFGSAILIGVLFVRNHRRTPARS